MAKKTTKARKRHTEEARLAEKVRKMDKAMEAMDSEPERVFAMFEALVDPRDSKAKKDLFHIMSLVRHAIEKGDARWAAYSGSIAGDIARGLGLRQKEADIGRKVLATLKSARNKEKGREPEYRATLKLVRKEEPGLLITAAKEEAARRCGVSYRTIHRYTK